jgi:hypothetical protein
MLTLERKFEIHPAYDKRPKYGQHCVEFLFYVKGLKGAVQFLLFTGWYPHLIPTPETDWRELTMPLHIAEHDNPMPADLGYHSPVPRYEGQKPQTKECAILGGPCYYDGSILNASRIFSIMLHQGGEAMWNELENYYRETFEAEEKEPVAHAHDSSQG